MWCVYDRAGVQIPRCVWQKSEDIVLEVGSLLPPWVPESNSNHQTFGL